MNHMFTQGFMGTRAPLFMDTTTAIVTLLPLLMTIVIWMARKKYIKLHIFANISLYIATLIVVGYFEYGVRVAGGYKSLSEGSQVGHIYLLAVLIVHIMIAVSNIAIWSYTIFSARKNSVEHPRRHKRYGMLTFYSLCATSITGIWVYLLLFVF